MALSFNNNSILRVGNSLTGSSIGTIRPHVPSCTITGLGNEDPSTVRFERDDDFPLTFEQVSRDGLAFVKIPRFYRKVNTITNGQLTSFTIAPKKIDNDYQLYPCFIRADGSETDYVLVGRDLPSNYRGYLENIRPQVQALGTGYQLYDWKLHRLIIDLLMVANLRISIYQYNAFNSLGINFGSYTYIDGCSYTSSYYAICYDPAKYVSNASPSTNGYTGISYTPARALGSYGGATQIKEMGYDTNNPFFIAPHSLAPDPSGQSRYNNNDSKFTTYYCAGIGNSNGGALMTFVSIYSRFWDLFYCGIASWNYNECRFNRVCYIPPA